MTEEHPSRTHSVDDNRGCDSSPAPQGGLRDEKILPAGELDRMEKALRARFVLIEDGSDGRGGYYTHAEPDPLCQAAANALIAQAKRVERLSEMLSELHALVLGECPRLLNEDSGGNAKLDLAIRSALSPRGEGEQGASRTDRSSAGTLADPIDRLSNDRGKS